MTIAEVTKKYGISRDTLRYYEKVGLIPRVSRGSGGLRDYNEQDCRWVEFAICMRGAGISVEVLAKYVALFQKGDDTLEERKALLVEQRDLLQTRMEDMQRSLNRLNLKIERHEKFFAHRERKKKTRDEEYLRVTVG